MSDYNTIKLFLAQGYSIEYLNKKFPQIGKNVLYKYLKIYNLEKFNQDTDNLLYHKPEWKKLKAEVIARDGRKCAICGSSKRLALEHVIAKALRPDLLSDINNLRLMCYYCHKKTLTFSRSGIRNTIKERNKLLKKISED